VEALDTALYRNDAKPWDGSALADAVRKVRTGRQQARKQDSQPLQLYPQLR
jgi:hypothetical protein